MIPLPGLYSKEGASHVAKGVGTQTLTVTSRGGEDNVKETELLTLGKEETIVVTD